MARVIGDIAIAVGADISPLQREMGKGSKVVKGFGNDTAAMSKKMAKAGAVVATAAVAMGAGLLAAGKSAAAAAVEVNNLSQVANAGTTEFQKMAAATATVNISQEKLADILKDVNDRVGDFVTTGGGPMKDFFEQIAPLVGVTADQFARLSGPEALQLYVTSLEKANLSQQEMTFFLEAMASDTTALLPLLRNGGIGIKTLGDEAERAGRILDEEMVASGVRLDKNLKEISATIKGNFNKAILDNSDAILDLSTDITAVWIPAIIDAGTKIAWVTTKIADMINTFVDAKAIFKGDGKGLVDKYGLSDTFLGGLASDIDPDFDSSGTYKPPNSGGDSPDSSTRPGWRKTRDGFGGNGSGGSGKGPTADDLERLQDQFATEAEIIQEAYEANLERLAEYRERKLATEEEFNELEARIKKDHLDAQQDLERKAMDAKLQMASGIFRNLSTLMRTENEKLFKIGKVAATANAIINTHQGITKALATVPYPANFAAAAAVAAKGFASVASIQSQSLSGGGGGGGAAGGGGASAASEPQQSTYFNVSLVGEGAIGRDSIRDLIDAINGALEDGARLRGITVN